MRMLPYRTPGACLFHEQTHTHHTVMHVTLLSSGLMCLGYSLNVSRLPAVQSARNEKMRIQSGVSVSVAAVQQQHQQVRLLAC